MVIVHSYVSLPEGIYYDPGMVSIYIWLQQRRLRQKNDVNLAKTYSIAKATMTATTTSTEKVGDLHSCCALNIFQRMPMKMELLCISCEWKPACSV